MELLKPSTCLVLENPFDGLDKKSCNELNNALQLESNKKRSLLIFINNRSAIPRWCSQLAVIDRGKLFFSDTMPEEAKLASLLDSLQTEQAIIPALQKKEEKQELVSLKNGRAGYGEKQLFSGLNLRIESGDHTLITGRNGCGKSTLFEIITGDNAQCYSNNLHIFGKKRGSGESIWEIKRDMGIISPALHRSHRGVGTVLDVVLSGLFDSIGLYTKTTVKEQAQAQKWLGWTGFTDLAQTPFSRLDYGKQRLILIARALVKEPQLLMLDEPTQGLDDCHRNRLLDLLEKAADQGSTTIFYISHLEDEYRSFFKQRIELEEYAGGEKSSCNCQKAV